MRLLHVTQSYYPFLDRGGPTVKVRALARGMASSGHAVTVLTADLGLDSAMRKMTGAVPGRWGFEAREDGVEAIYLRTRARYRSLTWNPGVAAFCRERLDGYDLTHIYGLYDLVGPRVAGACRRIARPYIVEPMGMFLPIVRSIWIKRLYHDTLGGRLLRGASRVIATSEQERQEFLEGGIARFQNSGPAKRDRNPREVSARRVVPQSVGHTQRRETCIVSGASGIKEESGT